MPQYTKRRKINDTTIPHFESQLRSAQWENILNENRPEYAFNNFFEVLRNSVDSAFPETKTKVSHKNIPLNPWMTPALMISRKQKDKLFSKKIRKPTPNNKINFQNYNKMYKKLIRSAKQNYYYNKFQDFSGQMKQTWDTIREVLGTKKCKSDIPDFFRDKGKIITGAGNIAEGFNDFFSGIGPELANKIPMTDGNYSDYLGDWTEENFIFGQVTPELVTEIAGKLKSKSSCGPDNISTKLLKHILPLIIEPICHIFNLSLQTGFIPMELKTAKVVPIYKSDDKHSFNNYRPISLLSSLSKLLEKIVAKQMVGFLYKHKILYKHQYGFRNGHSTCHPVLHFLDKIILALNKPNPEYTLGIFLDLKKAFDTVDHGVLLAKLNHYGFRGLANTWFKNYLGNRKQFVHINGENSSHKEMLCGVPQGSVLGPLLFLIFINDLPNCCKFFTLLFADDTTFQLTGSNLVNLFDLANSELNKASKWFQINKLTLNTSKTKYILFRAKTMHVNFSNLNLKIGCETVERIGNECKTKFFKFVGHHLDEYLSWEHQINHVRGKLASGNYAIARTKNFLPKNIRLTLYNSLFRPYLEFGILAWGGAPYKEFGTMTWGGVNATKLKGITNLQKKCVRNVAGKQFRSHTEPIFSSLKILKFTDLFKFNCSTFMHKLVLGKQPDSFQTMFTPLDGANRTKKFLTSISKNNFISQFPTIFLPKIWKANSLELKNIPKHKSFKTDLQNFFISQYNTHVNCHDPMCPDCK